MQAGRQTTTYFRNGKTINARGKTKTLNLSKLARAGFLRHYQANEIICQEGEAGHEMYIILKGEIEITFNNLELAFLGAGDFFGEMSLLEGLPRSATVRAKKDSTLLVMTEKNFKEVIQAEPLLALRIMKSLSRRIRRLNEEITRLKQVPTDNSQKEVKLQLPKEKKKDFPASKAPPAASRAADAGAKRKKNPYLYSKSVTCPVCNSTFTTTALMSSKLKLVKEDVDMRRHFEDIEPLFYSVWFCPTCFYANLHDNFLMLSEKQKKILKERTQERKQKFNADFGEPGEISQAVKGHLLVLKNYEQISAGPAQKAKIWLRLAWLYEDEKKEEEATQARQKALELFEKDYFTSRRQTTPEQEQQIAYLIGELYYRLGNYKKALNFFRRAAEQKGGKPVVKQQIQDRIYQVREMLKNSQADTETQEKQPEQ